MAVVIHWSPEALEDLEAIAGFIGRDSHFYARSVVHKMVETAAGLASLNVPGRTVPEFGQEHIRERVVHGYRLIYQIEKSQVLIMAIVHGKQLPCPPQPRDDCFTQ